VESQAHMDERIMEQALRWHAATARDDCDWQKLTEWLETSPLHQRAYDEVALLEDQITRQRQQLRDAAGIASTSTLRPAHRARGIWWSFAAAASVIIAVLVAGRPPLFQTGGEEIVVAEAGSSRAVSLDGGVQVILAPGSTLRISGRHDQRIRLDGAAWFDVPHDPRRELVIEAGAYQVRDIGTRFEVLSAADQFKVAVAEGEVGVVIPGLAQPASVRAGQHLLVAGSPPIAEYGDVAAEDVAGWRTGRLVFRNEPLSMVAAQLGRHAGLTVTVDPSIAQRRFSGVLVIGDGSQLVAELGRIMGLSEQRAGPVVHLSAADVQPASR
jgi:transmembrane sensor